MSVVYTLAYLQKFEIIFNSFLVLFDISHLFSLYNHPDLLLESELSPVLFDAALTEQKPTMVALVMM